MEIKLEREGELHFSSKNGVKAAIPGELTESDTKIAEAMAKKTKADVVVVDAKFESHLADSQLLISEPGEYEKDEMFITVFNLQTADSITELVELEIDSVRILYYSHPRLISKDTLVEIGIVDVLLIDPWDNHEKMQELVNMVDPKVVVALPSREHSESRKKFIDSLGIKFSAEKKLKFKAAEFASDDFVLVGYEFSS